MQVRIKFSEDLIITACDMEEVKRKWEGMPLFSQEAKDCSAEFSEILLVEDAEDYTDLMDEFNNA